MTDIFAYARKFGSRSNQTVSQAIRIGNRFTNKELMKKGIIELGVNKMDLISRIIDKDSEEFWINKVKTLNYNTVLTLVQEIEYKKKKDCSKIQNGGLLEENLKNQRNTAQNIEAKQSPKGEIQVNQNLKTQIAAPIDFKVQLNTESQKIYNRLKKKLKIEDNRSISIQKMLEVLEKLVDANEEKVEFKKTSKSPSKTPKKSLDIQEDFAYKKAKSNAKIKKSKEDFREKELKLNNQKNKKQVSRHIPIKIKRQILARSKGSCEYENCSKTYDCLHHINPFSISKSHSPQNIVALCNEHHSIIHSNLNTKNPKISYINKKIQKKKIKHLATQQN